MRLTITTMALGIALCAVALLVGCSSGQQVTRTDTTVTRTAQPPPTRMAYADDTAPPYPSDTTTTTTTTESSEPDSVLGATAHAVGTVIMLPFRVVGDTLGLIF